MKSRLSIALLVSFLTLFVMLPKSYASQELDKALIYHTYFGSLKDVERMLEKGASPNATDEHGWPVLAIAADRSDKQAYPIAKILVRKGADVNAAHERNYPLLNAIKNNNEPLVALLVSEEANLRARGPDGTPLYSTAKKLKNPTILYYIEKRLFEEQQLRSFLNSTKHLKQMSQIYRFDHCAFQYWGYYLRSKQDKDMKIEQIKDRMRQHAFRASATGERIAQYFPQFTEEKLKSIATKQRQYVSKLLNDMISNRNRRAKGVGKIKDMAKRCYLSKTPTYFHAEAIRIY